MATKFGLSQLVEIARVRTLTDLLHKTTGISVSVTDAGGAVLADSGWQEICRDFHGISPETRQWCRRSGAGGIVCFEGGRKHFEKCRNGLIDVTTPITMAGEHVADFSAGQFLLHPPDIKFFKQQALRAGFDEAAYLKAVSKVPVIDEARLHAFFQCVSLLPEILTEAGITNFIREMDKREKERSPDPESRSLEDVNAALRTLLAQREEEKRQLEENILSNVKELVLPYLEKLKTSGLSVDQVSTLDVAETNLKEITSPIIRKMQTLGLTPREITVASLLKEGKTTEEIAALLRVSRRAVEFHRYTMRKKLKLDTKMSLQAYLQSIA